MRKPNVACGMGLALIANVVAATLAVEANAQWPQWGGPNRNFTVETTGLADEWSEDGPKKLWRRELGDGYSSILVDGGMLYTMYRKSPTDEVEYSIALDAATGATRWEFGNPSPLTPGDHEHGFGPNSTPLISGERLFSVGARAVMHCLNRKEGTVIWKHDLAREYGAAIPGDVGYSVSPLAYKNLVIVPLGRPPRGTAPGQVRNGAQSTDSAGGRTLAAFDQATGRIVWRSQDFVNSHSSPILINFNGQDQVVLLMYKRDGLMGVDPSDGRLLWHYPFPGEYGNQMSPLWNGADLLLCSNGSGSRVIRLTTGDGETVPEELWYNKKIRFAIASPVRMGDFALGATGQGLALIMGVDMRTGERRWARKGFHHAACVSGGDRVIFLDWNGQLALTSASPEGLTIHARCQTTERYSFTVPTLAGTTLYVRDRKHIMALDLG